MCCELLSVTAEDSYISMSINSLKKTGQSYTWRSLALPHGRRGTLNESVTVKGQEFLRTCWILREKKRLEGDGWGMRDKDESLI